MELSKNQSKYHSLNPLKRICLYGFRRDLLKTIKALPIKSVLDAGCGEGYAMLEIKKLRPDWIVDGFDLSDRAVKLAGKRLPGCRLRAGDIYRIPYPPKTHDLIIALEVLEHLSEPEKALAEIRRHADKYALVSVPLEPWFSLGNLLSGKNLRYWGNEPEHLQQWNAGGIRALVKKYFHIESVRIAFPWTIILGKQRTGGKAD